MDIKAKIQEIVDKIKADPQLLSKFEKDPITVVEQLLGVDLPNDQLQGVVDAVKAKINVVKIGDAVGGLGKLFGKLK